MLFNLQHVAQIYGSSSLRFADGLTDQKGSTYNEEQNGFLISADFAKISQKAKTHRHLYSTLISTYIWSTNCCLMITYSGGCEFLKHSLTSKWRQKTPEMGFRMSRIYQGLPFNSPYNSRGKTLLYTRYSPYTS